MLETLTKQHDSKLFLVKLNESGKEREVCIQLAEKARHWVEMRKPCLVSCVFASEHLKGCIYVEAPNEGVVKDFVHGIRRVQWYSVKVVPVPEMISVFRAATEFAREKFEPLLV